MRLNQITKIPPEIISGEIRIFLKVQTSNTNTPIYFTINRIEWNENLYYTRTGFHTVFINQK